MEPNHVVTLYIESTRIYGYNLLYPLYIYIYIFKIILTKPTTTTTQWWRQLGGCRFIVKAVHCWSWRRGNVASWQREPALLSAARSVHTHIHEYTNRIHVLGTHLHRRATTVEDLPRGRCSAVASGPAVSLRNTSFIFLFLLSS